MAWDRPEAMWVATDCPPLRASSRATGAIIGARSPDDTRIAHPREASIPAMCRHGRPRIRQRSQNGARLQHAAEPTRNRWLSIARATEKGQGPRSRPTASNWSLPITARASARSILPTFKTTLLPHQDGKPLRGIDGLVRCRSTYFGIYNGAAPGMLVSITSDATRESAFDQPLGAELPDPTQVAYDGSGC